MTTLWQYNIINLTQKTISGVEWRDNTILMCLIAQQKLGQDQIAPAFL